MLSVGGGSVDQGFRHLPLRGSNGAGLNYRVYGMGFTRSPEFHADHRNFDDWRMVKPGFVRIGTRILAIP